MKILIFNCIQLYSFPFLKLGSMLISEGDVYMQVILLNTNNGSAFEMKFSSAREMKNYLEKNADVEFLTECNSYLPTRHQRMQHPVWKARAIFYAKWCATKHNTTCIHRNARITSVNDLIHIVTLDATIMASGSLTFLVGCGKPSYDCNEVCYL